MSYYDILCVDKSATFEQIKISYRKLAKEHHPDKGGNKEKFQQIQDAYEILSDTNRRNEYDMKNNFQSMNFGNINMMFGGNGFGINHPLFHVNLGGGGNGGHNRLKKKRNEEYILNINLENVYTGMSKNFNIMRKTQCDNCKIECSICKGSGFIVMNVQIGPIVQMIQQNCDHCRSLGSFRNQNVSCNKCENTGFCKKEKFVSIDIPKSVENGKRYIIDGWGEQAVNKNEINGDFIIIINVEKHNDFERNNFNLIYKTNLNVIESIIGKDLEIIYFQNETIKMNTNKFGIINFDDIYTIKDKGLIDENGNRGDLLIKFELKYNEDYKNIILSEEQVNVLKEKFYEYNLK
jgi:DnaJ-class molecular chaperone